MTIKDILALAIRLEDDEPALRAAALVAGRFEAHAGLAPGKDLAIHLARHGVTVRVNNMDGMGRSEGRALLDCAITVGADILVLGAYGHSRAEEWLLGGVTRELTQTSPLPLFMSH